ncbi:MAG: DUF3299 domain-containing protein [Pseudomonadota bacterium]
MKTVLFILFALIATPAFSEEPQTLNWEDLLPEGEIERLDELYAAQPAMPLFGHSAYNDPMMGGMPVQIGTFNVVEELEGKLVRVPGFVLQFEYSASGEVSEFLLVPYFGACIHTPPPPPNQMVYVKAEKPADLGQQWNAIWAIGILRTQKHLNELGDAAYTLELQRWEQYDG